MNPPEQEEVLQEQKKKKDLLEEAFWCGERLWASFILWVCVSAAQHTDDEEPPGAWRHSVQMQWNRY